MNCSFISQTDRKSHKSRESFCLFFIKKKLFYCRVIITYASSKCQLTSSVMKPVIKNSQPVCATDKPSVVFKVRSATDCQQRCTTWNNTCFMTNFYTNTSRCEVFDFFPVSFKNIENCKMFRVCQNIISATVIWNNVCKNSYLVDDVIFVGVSKLLHVWIASNHIVHM